MKRINLFLVRARRERERGRERERERERELSNSDCYICDREYKYDELLAVSSFFFTKQQKVSGRAFLSQG